MASSLPWGIKFRYQSGGHAQVTLTVVRAAVANTWPDLLIREALNDGGWFEAVAPQLPAYVARDATLSDEFRSRLEQYCSAIAEVRNVKDPQLLTDVPPGRVRAFLWGNDAPVGNAEVDQHFGDIVTSHPFLQARLLRWDGRSSRLPLLLRLFWPPMSLLAGSARTDLPAL